MFTALFLPFGVLVLIGAIRLLCGCWRSGPQPGGAALRWTSLGILAVGCAASAWIYRTAAPDAGAIAYRLENGVIIPLYPGDSKRYDRELETLGGRALLLAADIMRWYRTREPAYLLFGLSLAASAACLSLGRLPDAPPGPGGGPDGSAAPPPAIPPPRGTRRRTRRLRGAGSRRSRSAPTSRPRCRDDAGRAPRPRRTSFREARRTG